MFDDTPFLEVFTISFAIVFCFSLFVSSMTARHGEIMTAESCVTQKWAEFEDRTNTMPSTKLEAQWRDDCWVDMGATFEVE